MTIWTWNESLKIYNCLCNQCLSPLMRVWILIRARCTTLCDKVCQWLATGWWFSPGPPVSSTNKTEILLKVVLNTIKQNKLKIFIFPCSLISHLQYRNVTIMTTITGLQMSLYCLISKDFFYNYSLGTY